MHPRSATKCTGVEEKPKAPLGQPMRIHEILGLPKSAGKTLEHQPSHRLEHQPVRIKHMLESADSCSRPRSNSSVSARRTTVAPASIRNIRRQLYNESADQTLPDKSMLAGGSQNTAETSVNGLFSVGSHGKSQPVRLGLSKSDGKAKTNGQRSQPLRVKDLLASWEKSQTAKPAGKKSIADSRRTMNVRRKLYSVVPSPVPTQKDSRKSLAPSKFQVTSTVSNKTRKVIKPNAEKSTKVTASRKSCLLPPNSIRNMHISRQAKETTIVEESPTAISPDVENIGNTEKTHKNEKSTDENVPKIPKVVDSNKAKSPSRNSAKIVASSSEQFGVAYESHAIIPRPTVIMATSTIEKNRIRSVSSETSDKSAFELSRPALQELNKNSSMPVHRLDAVDTSLDDLLGKSQADNENFRASNLPCNSFLRNWDNHELSLARMDRQTLAWFHANLKLCVQTTEESLFSMKQMLKTIEDIVTSNTEPEEKLIKNNCDVATNIPKIIVENIETASEEKIAEKNIHDSLPISFAPDCVAFVEKRETSCEEVFDVDPEEDKENRAAENSPARNEEPKENCEKTRRRSARLAALKQQRSPKVSDDSFTRIEAELNITHEKTKPSTPRRVTPAKRTQLDPRSRRSIREYMALKSCIKFLQTPDHKGLPTPIGDKTGTPAQRRASERALSRQLLTQLNDLYDDSPD